jgi:hypothetical protein
MLHVAMAALLLAVPSGDAQRSFCRDASQMRDLNLPPNTTSNSTDIVHSSIIYVADRFVGYLYVTQSEQVFVHFGSIGRLINLAAADERLAATAFGAKASSGFQRLNLANASLAGLNIMACY